MVRRALVVWWPARVGRRAAWGYARIHSVDCTRSVGAFTRPTNAGALRNGAASIARCCASHESHMLAVWLYVEASA